MPTNNYSDILRGSTSQAGMDPTDLDPSERSRFRTYHDRRLQVAWESHRWPDICDYQKRSFRAPWNSATSYVATNEVLDIVSLNYFQALQPNTDQAPTTPAASGGFTINSYFWAPSLMQYQADDYIATGAYVQGSQVRNPTDGLYYQLFAPQIVVAGAGASATNGTYSFVSLAPNGTPVYQNGGTAYFLSCANGTTWIIHGLAGDYYHSGVFGATPDLATGWFSTDTSGNPNPVNNPVPTFTASVPAPPNTSCWGLLTPFNRYVGFNQAWETTPIEAFLSAWDFDPRMTTKVCKLPYLMSADGAQFTTLRHVPAYVWLLIRPPRPQLTGDEYDPTVAYAAGAQMYYTDPTGAGNFFNCVSATTAGQSPTTNPSLWAIVPLPYVFRQYMIEGGYADWLRGDGQTDKADAIEQVAENMLEFEADKQQRQQQQVNRFTFKSL